MNIKSVEVELVKEAESNPAASAVFHLLAMRTRDRSTLNLSGLYNTMRKEGFPFTKKEYMNVLAFLSNLKLGTMSVTKRGRIIGLKDIPVNLKSIGTLACKVGSKALVERRRVVERPIILPTELKADSKVVIYVKGKPVTLTLSPDSTPEDIAFIIKKFYT